MRPNNFSISINNDNKAGTIIKVNKVENNNPPIIAVPKPLYSSDPGEPLMHIGSNPKTVVMVLMKTGRSRVRTLSRIDSWGVHPLGSEI